MEEEVINSTLEYIEKNFKEGNDRLQILNLKGLINYLRQNTKSNIDLVEAEELLKRSSKLNKMISTIIKVDKNDSLLDNDIAFTLATSYANMNNIELSFEEENEEEYIDYDEEEAMYDRRSNDLDLLKLYVGEFSDAKVLTTTEETELFKKLEENPNNKEIIDEIVYHNLRLVVCVARRYKNKGLPFADLIQDGNLGLLKAIERFDYKKGYRFSTYASWWIRQSITRSLADNGRNIRVPVHMCEYLTKMRKFMNKYLSTYGREPSYQELMTELNVSEERLKELILCEDTVSLNQTVPNSEGKEESELGEFIEEPRKDYGLFDDELIKEDFKKAVFTSSSLKNERDKLVILYRFGFIDGRIYTLEEVGEMFHLTRERIRQIETKVIKSLRREKSIRAFGVQDESYYRYYDLKGRSDYFIKTSYKKDVPIKDSVKSYNCTLKLK